MVGREIVHIKNPEATTMYSLLNFPWLGKTCTLQSKRSIGDCIFPLPQAFQRGSIWIHLIGPFSEAPV